MQSAPITIVRLSRGGEVLAERLNTLFGEAFGDAATYQGDRPSHEYLEQLLAKDDMIVLVALADGELMGGLVAYEFPKLESARREIYIYDLAVREAHRRRGIASGAAGLFAGAVAIGQTAQQAQPKAPQKLRASEAGTSAASAAAWSWPWTAQADPQPQARASFCFACGDW